MCSEKGRWRVPPPHSPFAALCLERLARLAPTTPDSLEDRSVTDLSHSDHKRVRPPRPPHPPLAPGPPHLTLAHALSAGRRHHHDPLSRCHDPDPVRRAVRARPRVVPPQARARPRARPPPSRSQRERSLERGRVRPDRRLGANSRASLFSHSPSSVHGIPLACCGAHLVLQLDASAPKPCTARSKTIARPLYSFSTVPCSSFLPRGTPISFTVIQAVVVATAHRPKSMPSGTVRGRFLDAVSAYPHADPADSAPRRNDDKRMSS